MPRRLRRVKHARPRTVSIHTIDQLRHGHDFLGDGFGRDPDPEVVRPVWDDYGAQLTSDLLAENAECRSKWPPSTAVANLEKQRLPHVAELGSGVPGVRQLRPWGFWLCEAPEQRNHYDETELEQLERLDLITDLERTLLHLEEA